MSSRKKGNQYEKEAREIFIHLGYTVWPNKSLTTARFIGSNKFISQDQDIFGVIDFLAMNGWELFFVQVKAFTDGDHTHATRARKAIDKLTWPDDTDITLLVLARVDKKPYNFKTWGKDCGTEKWHIGYLDGKVPLKLTHPSRNIHDYFKGADG